MEYVFDYIYQNYGLKDGNYENLRFSNPVGYGSQRLPNPVGYGSQRLPNPVGYENQRFSNPVGKPKIIEIGVGFYFEVAKKLKENGANITVVDANEKAIEEARNQLLNGVVDDIFNPNMDIYRGSDLIYSIRPPRDLQPFIYDIAKKVSCDLIIKPLHGEQPIECLKLINYKGNPLYIWSSKMSKR
ncbi:MAG: uncharacterized protein PWP15_1329 [Methanothermococcus sp.]|nr:uncharacterized protein [Methanothermococcus sp.]